MNEPKILKSLINSSYLREETGAYISSSGKRGQGATGSVSHVLMLAVFFLGAAHLSVKTFFPNPAFWVIGASIIVAGGLAWIVFTKDYFGFLLALFVCVHFNFAENQGGLWGYVLVAVILAALFLGGFEIKFSSVPRILNLFVLVFLFVQVLGTVFNPYSLVSNIQATVIAAAQVLAFYLFASQKITVQKLKRFLSVWFLVAVWVFVMGINQRYQWLITSSPLMPQREYLAGVFAHIPAASFGNSELFGEYFSIIFAFSMILSVRLKELKDLHIRKMFFIAMIFVSLAGFIIGGSRSAVLLALLAMFYIIFVDFAIAPSIRSLRRSALVFGILSVAVGFIFIFGSYFFLDKMADDFRKLNPSKMTAGSVVSGRGINRGNLFIIGWNKLTRESWLVGYGYNIPENNKKSIGFKKSAARDFHNLYLSLPFFYGWFGAIAYVLLLVGTFSRIYISYIRETRKTSTYLTPIALGFSVLWGIFLLDQYKIGVTRNPNFFLMTWMWLGLTHAVANSMANSLRESKTLSDK